ncbi:hypothetical protein MMPV_002105 [Pyropia vietnamensis]
MRLRPDGSLWVVRPPAAAVTNEDATGDAAAAAMAAGVPNVAGELAATQRITRSTWRRGTTTGGATAVIPRAMVSRSQPAVVMTALDAEGGGGASDALRQASLSRSDTAMAGGGASGALVEPRLADDVPMDPAGIEVRSRPPPGAAGDEAAAAAVAARRQRASRTTRSAPSGAANSVAGVAAAAASVEVPSPPPPPPPTPPPPLPARPPPPPTPPPPPPSSFVPPLAGLSAHTETRFGEELASVRREREAALAASLRANRAATAAAAALQSSPRVPPVVPSTADAVMYAARLEAALASRDADAATLRAAVAALTDDRNRETAVRWTVESPRTGRPADVARAACGARGGDRAVAAGGGDPEGSGGGRGSSIPTTLRASSSLRLSSTDGGSGSHRGREERAARREERRHLLGTAMPGGGRGRRRLGEVLFSSASGGVLGGMDGGGASSGPAASASVATVPASPPYTQLASVPLIPLHPRSTGSRTPQQGGQSGRHNGNGRGSNVERGGNSSRDTRSSDGDRGSRQYDTSSRRADRTDRSGGRYLHSDNRIRSGGSGYVQVPISSDDDGETPYTWRAGDTTGGRNRETGATPGTTSFPSVNGGSPRVGPRRVVHGHTARLLAAPAERLGPLRRPSLVALTVLLTLTVPLAVVRLTVDGDDVGTGMRGVGNSFRHASSHMLNGWTPPLSLSSLPTLPAMSSLSALAHRSMSAAVSAGGAIVRRTAQVGAASPSALGTLPSPLAGSFHGDGGVGGGGAAAAVLPPPAPVVVPTDARGGAWPVDTAGEVEEVDPPPDGIVSLSSLLSGRFSKLLAPALLSRAPWLFPPVSCSRPRVTLQLDDEDRPLPGTLRLLRSCDGPSGGGDDSCEPDLSAHIPDMRRVHVALPLPATPPGLLTVYPSGHPGQYDEQVAAEEAAGELAATVLWYLEDDGVVVLARGCVALNAADVGVAEVERAFTVRELRSLGASWGSGGAQVVKRVFSGEIVAAAGAVAPVKGGKGGRVGGVDTDLPDEEVSGWGSGGVAAPKAAAPMPVPAATVVPRVRGVSGAASAGGPLPVGSDDGGVETRPPLLGREAAASSADTVGLARDAGATAAVPSVGATEGGDSAVGAPGTTAAAPAGALPPSLLDAAPLPPLPPPMRPDGGVTEATASGGRPGPPPPPGGSPPLPSRQVVAAGTADGAASVSPLLPSPSLVWTDAQMAAQAQHEVGVSAVAAAQAATEAGHRF